MAASGVCAESFDSAIGKQRAALRLHGDVAARRTAGGDHRAGAQRHIMGSRQGDVPAARAQYAAVGNDIGFEPDVTVDVGQCAGFDDAVVVDDGFYEGIRCPGLQQYVAAVRFNQPLVVGQCVQSALIDGQADELVAIQMQADFIARRQRHTAAIGGERAGVFYLRANQGYHPAVGDNVAGVGDAAGRAFVNEVIAPGHEGFVRQAQRRGHQPAHVDLRALAEQHAVRIENKDLPVGAETAEDFAGVLAQHAVKRNAGGRRLCKTHGFAGADAEILPVDGRAVGGLRNEGIRTGAGNAGLPGNDLLARRPRPQWRCPGHEHGGNGSRHPLGR